jgi:hypothetical protein
LVGSFDKFCGSDFVNAGCFFPQTSLPQIDLLKVCNSVGAQLYEKGVMGHVTIDLISFPNTEDPDAHPFFQAVDISTELTNNAAIVYFFDILMEGKLEQQTGEYSISWSKEEEAAEDADVMSALTPGGTAAQKEEVPPPNSAPGDVTSEVDAKEKT